MEKDGDDLPALETWARGDGDDDGEAEAEARNGTPSLEVLADEGI